MKTTDAHVFEPARATLPDYSNLTMRLKHRLESYYDSKVQGMEWRLDALCLEAAAAITALQARVAELERMRSET